MANKRTKDTKKTLAVQMTQQACDACSQSSDFLDVLLTQTVNSAPLGLVAEDRKNQFAAAAAGALIGIKPKGEIEGMLAAQLVACHNAVMECYRRAMNSQLPARDYYLNQANKLSRTYAILLDNLNKHRGKGQQKVTVEHVHVHQGGQAIVGHIEHKGEGGREKKEGQPRAKAISDVGEPPMRGEDSERHALSIPCHAERPLPNARRQINRRTQGQQERLEARVLRRDSEG